MFDLLKLSLKNLSMRKGISSNLKDYKTTLHDFLVRNTLISNISLTFDLKEQQSVASKGVKRKIDMSERLAE